MASLVCYIVTGVGQRSTVVVDRRRSTCEHDSIGVLDRCHGIGVYLCS